MYKTRGAKILFAIACLAAMVILLSVPFSDNITFRQGLVLVFAILFLTPPLTILIVQHRPRQAFVSLIACFSGYIFFLGLCTLSYSIHATILASCTIAMTAIASETLLIKARPFGAIVNLIVGGGFVFLLGGLISDAYAWGHGLMGAIALWVIGGAIALILNTRRENERTLYVNPLQPESYLDV